MTVLLTDDFTGTAYTLTDNQVSPNSKWRCIYAGYGWVKDQNIPEPKGGRAGSCLQLRPQTNESGTSACLVLSEATNLSDFDSTFYIRTFAHTRTSPNNWEVIWIMFRYTDNTHHYYFMIKRDGGIEVGGKDYVKIGTTQIQTPDNVTTTVGAGNQDQRFFLDTSASVTFALQQWYKIRLLVVGANIKIYVDDTLKVNVTDNGSTGSWLGSSKTFSPSSAMASGKLGPYVEDAEGHFDQVVVNSVP